VINVIDIVFNPYTFELCRKSEAFKNMVCDVAIEGAGK
jgi:hypothetical protein